jgi:hypothetical protein
MAYNIEEIYQSFAEAMTTYNEAVAAVNESVTQLKAAERKLEKAFDEFSVYMGANTLDDYNIETGVLSLFNGKGKKGFDLGDAFDFGGLF